MGWQWSANSHKQRNYKCKTCVITVSTSAFNSGKIKFTPALPIENTKLMMLFPVQIIIM